MCESDANAVSPACANTLPILTNSPATIRCLNKKLAELTAAVSVASDSNRATIGSTFADEQVSRLRLQVHCA